MSLLVQAHFPEHDRIPERPVQFAGQDWTEIDNLGCPIGEIDAQQMRADAFERLDPMNRMLVHDFIVAERSAGAVRPS